MALCRYTTTASRRPILTLHQVPAEHEFFTSVKALAEEKENPAQGQAFNPCAKTLTVNNTLHDPYTAPKP